MTVLDTLPCSLPTRDVPSDVNPASICQLFDKRINQLDKGDFTKDAMWRDMFALTSTIRTFYSASDVLPLWRSLSQERRAADFKIQHETAFVKRDGPQLSWIEVSFTFSMGLPLTASCLGYLCLVLDSDDKWKIWILGTILDRLPGLGDVDHLDPVEKCHGSGYSPDEANISTQQKQAHQKQHHYDCVIIGGGQSGLCTAGRLQALGVSYICVDSNNEVGDSWRLRYDSSKFHTIRESSHLPFERNFTPDYPEWLSKDDLADAFKTWSEKYGLTPHIWLSTTLESASWNELTRKWTANLRKRHPGSKGQSELITVMSSHIVLAIGVNSDVPLIPEYANKSDFKGITMHSKDYKNSLDWKGKHGVVVGTANTGHDIAEDMLNAGLASVTIIQRSKTYVIPQKSYILWAETQYGAQIDMKTADIKCFGYPNAVSRKLGLFHTHLQYTMQPDLYSDLEKAGFLLERNDDLTRNLCDRLGGHYMDIGTSQKIADGLIKMKTGSLPVSYTKSGLLFDNGSHLDADVIVFATGFHSNMGNLMRRFFGDKVADRAGDCWGLDGEGEIKGAFKPIGQPGLWYIAGGINHSRFYSRFIAMQIKAAVEGIRLPVFDSKQSWISPKL